MFTNYLPARRFAMLITSGLLLVSTACQKEVETSPTPAASSATADAKGSREFKNKGRYLSFTNQADFLAEAKELDKLAANEGTAEHLEKWEKKTGFHSLRAHYAKKRQEREARERRAAGVADQASAVGAQALLPEEDDGNPTPPYFEPYEEPWDEGLIIEDDYFAAMLSPEGTVEIGGKIFRIDLANNIVSYIPSSQASEYDQFVSAQPTDESASSIRYFDLTEDVLGLLDGGDSGSSFSEFRPGRIRIGSGIGCGPGADRKHDKANQYYADNRRLDCKIVYQPLGIYHSIVAKAHHQKKTWYGAWVGSPATMYIQPNPGTYWQPLCETYVESDQNSYDNFNAPYLGNHTGDHNTVTHRYFNSMKGVKRYKADVKFRVGQFITRVFSIQDEW
ncbi:hypothetical protein [Hymenobacter weizhouensis]|uniref:hypothetical protein n=1 Tax=Hymenobacter sp. YIM 151500-1 TaxID=2987689 RepID=UPI0022266BE3|nr:hypothetical protein [Hymenobacter sp. YIM 151500-1]UYZ62300.1 hypothetical protein OIS53_15030 [Hymenobacter sp. YIM 151500-1]